MIVGTCALCQTKNVDLLKSHILPKFGYKRIRDNSGGNPNPIHVTIGKAVQTSKQITEYLLCQQCEHRISISETYVADLTYDENGDCPLYSMLGYTSAITDLTTAATTEALPCGSKLDLNKMIYFAVSVFWRSAVSTTKDTDAFVLDAASQEKLRRYLMGNAAELSDIPIILKVIDQPRGAQKFRFDGVLSVPGSGNVGTYRIHSFLFGGLLFYMFEGSNIPSAGMALSLNHGNPPHIAFAAPATLKMVEKMIALVRSVPGPPAGEPSSNSSPPITAHRPTTHEQRIRERAYFHAENRTGGKWWDPVANWLQAEFEEPNLI